MLERTTQIKWWDDTKIKSGDKWDEKIKEALSKAKVIVLMVSANFFASDYIWRDELPEILAAADAEGATILWLPVSFCAYEDTAIAKYQAITEPKEPIEGGNDSERNKAYTKLVRSVKELFKIPSEA
jgi:internalin A